MWYEHVTKDDCQKLITTMWKVGFSGTDRELLLMLINDELLLSEILPYADKEIRDKLSMHAADQFLSSGKYVYKNGRLFTTRRRRIPTKEFLANNGALAGFFVGNGKLT